MVKITTSWRHVLLAFAVLVFWAPQARSADSALKPFFGHFVGQTLFETDKDISARDLDVRIQPLQRGFSMEWTTLTHRADGRRKQTFVTVNFQATRHPGVYRSANRVNRQGVAIPVDPMSGDPYIWAKLVDRTLTVYAMIVNDDGGYEIQTYDRTVVADGLELRFERIRNGAAPRVIRANLTRRPN